MKSILLNPKENKTVRKWRKVMAIGLVACSIGIFPDGCVVSLQTKAPPNPILIKQHLDQLGAGAKVKVKLAHGKELRGYIEAIEEAAFLLNAEQKSSPRRIAYHQVEQLKQAKLSYRVVNQPDPVEARRVVAALGIGKHVMVKVIGGKKVRGRIQAIEPDHFTLRLNRQGMPLQIAYLEVGQVGANLSRGQKIAIIGAIAASIIVLVAYWATHVDT